MTQACRAGLSVDTLAEYVAELKASGASAAKTNLALSACRSALLQTASRGEMSVREQAVLKTALAEIKSVKRGASEVRVISREERLKLIAEMPEKLALVVRFTYATGCRISEVLHVGPGDCKRDGSMVRVRMLGKGAKERYVRIPGELLSEIRRVFRKRGEFLFQGNQGKVCSRTYVTGEIGRFSMKILGKRVNARQLRSSRATSLYERTRDLKGDQRDAMPRRYGDDGLV